MKKRAMKKWIPKGTYYCYDSNSSCKWRKYITTTKFHRDTNCKHAENCKEECWTKPNNCCQNSVYRCEFLKYTDWNEDSLLWDEVKSCNISEISEEEYKFFKTYKEKQ